MSLRLFLDRSVGTRKFATALRARHLDVETIVDRYGAANLSTPDERWIADASRDGRLLVSADQRIRYRPLERMAICEHAAKCVTFAAGNLTSDEMIGLFLENLTQIEEAAREAGPFVYHLTRQRLVRMALDCTTPPA